MSSMIFRIYKNCERHHIKLLVQGVCDNRNGPAHVECIGRSVSATTTLTGTSCINDYYSVAPSVLLPEVGSLSGSCTTKFTGLSGSPSWFVPSCRWSVDCGLMTDRPICKVVDRGAPGRLRPRLLSCVAVLWVCCTFAIGTGSASGVEPTLSALEMVRGR